MICSASLLPCSPYLIPTIKQEDLKNFSKITTALKKFSQTIADLKPDVILTIFSQGPVLKNAFSLNLAQEYLVDFKNFGDLSTKMSFKSDLELNYKIKEKFEIDFPNTPLIMITEPRLTYHLAVPLYYFYQKYKNFSLIPIYSSSLDYQKHFEFGWQLREGLTLTNKRIALILPWQFSQVKNKEKNSLNQALNQEIIELITQKDVEQILKTEPTIVKKVGLDNFPGLIILLGLLRELNYQPEVLAQESLLNTLYTIIDFKLL